MIRLSTIEQSVVVNMPVRAVYNQWTQFETYPQFMKHVEEVKQVDATHLRWRARIYGVEREWESEIVEQIPDRRVAWRSSEIDGSDGTNAGAVTFHRLDEDHTRVMLQMEVEPDGLAERVADATGIIADRASGDLESFKEFIEERGAETGAWRGRVPQRVAHLPGSALSAADLNVANTGALEEWTRDDLYSRARELGIAGRSKMRKLELIEAIRQRQG